MQSGQVAPTSTLQALGFGLEWRAPWASGDRGVETERTVNLGELAHRELRRAGVHPSAKACTATIQTAHSAVNRHLQVSTLPQRDLRGGNLALCCATLETNIATIALIGRKRIVVDSRRLLKKVSVIGSDGSAIFQPEPWRCPSGPV